jgi:hypothetical protein
MRRFIRFASIVTVIHVVTYIGVGVLAYIFLTRDFFNTSNVLVAQVMRTPEDPKLWSHVTRWMLPFQVIRGVLIAVVLYPFLSTLRSWNYWKRVATIGGLYVVLGQWASTVAGSGTIEGWLILRPEFTSANIVIKAMIEGFVQGLALATWLARSIMSAKLDLHLAQADQENGSLIPL